MSHRKLKKQALALMRADDWAASRKTLLELTPRRIINPLLGLLCHGEPLIRWRAVTAIGLVVSTLANQELESARVIMRRLMWTLNDESGGIGWGSPESLGDIMARHARLANEFSCILVSYTDPDGNYLEHSTLQQGVLWAWGRLGRSRPSLIQPVSGLLMPFLLSSDLYLRGLAAWAAKPLKAEVLQEPLKKLVADGDEISIYADNQLRQTSVGRLARSALAEIAS